MRSSTQPTAHSNRAIDAENTMGSRHDTEPSQPPPSATRTPTWTDADTAQAIAVVITTRAPRVCGPSWRSV